MVSAPSPEHGREVTGPGGGSTGSASRLHGSRFFMCGVGRGGETEQRGATRAGDVETKNACAGGYDPLVNAVDGTRRGSRDGPAAGFLCRVARERVMQGQNHDTGH
jgi:hypothetical protein